MPAPIEILGLTFGRLTVLRETDRYYFPSGHSQRQFIARCTCGTETVVLRGSLTSGNTASCGCIRQELRDAGNNNLSHGHARPGATTPEYRAWQNMISRCTNPRRARYKSYGGRGIKVCERWLHSFEAFLQDVGPRPSPTHSIDRIDNDGNYTPDNVRWSTARVQVNNRSRNHRVSYCGKVMSLVEAVRAAGNIVAATTARARLRLGWAIEPAVETPPQG